MAERTLEQLSGGYICRGCGAFVHWNEPHYCPLAIVAAGLAPKP